MNIVQIKKILMPLIILIVLGYFGYTLFIAPPIESVLLDETATGESTESSDVSSGKDILTLIFKLKNAEIDQSLFSSALFSNLRDFEQALVPEAKGRPNPFAPIGSDGGAVQTPTIDTTAPRKVQP